MADISHKKIGEILIENGLITESQLAEALTDQRRSGSKIGDIIVKKGWVSPEEIDRCGKIVIRDTGIVCFTNRGDGPFEQRTHAIQIRRVVLHAPVARHDRLGTELR